jgi:predicted dehydrogenase
MGFKLGICGTGSFAGAFIPIFQAHPLISEVLLADLLPERRAAVAAEFGVRRTLASHAELCASDVDAIAIFAQRHLHGPLTVEALAAGKHVYCAVPMASSLEEIAAIIAAVERSGCVYMSGETSYYYPSALYCRERFRQGDFGAIVHGVGAYFHDMSHGFEQAFQHSGGEEWRRVAGIPPMFYPTHSTSLILSVTGARATQVACMGYRDQAGDGIFGAGQNLWNNPFSNQTALLQTSDGGTMTLHEFRRIGWWGRHSSNPLSVYGTRASFEENSAGYHWTSLAMKDPRDLTPELQCARHYAAPRDTQLHEALQRDFNSQFARVQPVGRLPREFVGVRNGHLGSHQFLVDDFAKAVARRHLPPVHAWEAARYCAPGLVAHDSCLAGGQALAIPDFGEAPSDWARLDPALEA